MKNRSNILNMKPFIIATLMLIPVMLLCSCEKEVTEIPTLFDATIDGVAVVPVPDIDIRMAQRDATVPGYRNTAAFDGPIVQTPDLPDLSFDLTTPISTDPNFL